VPVTEDWIVRLREMFQKVEKMPPSEPKPKPLQPDLPLAKLSCPFPAGSIEKIAVMRARAECGEAIFHPLDCKLIAVRQSHKST
jgi:hypothetical protein